MDKAYRDIQGYYRKKRTLWGRVSAWFVWGMCGYFVLVGFTSLLVKWDVWPWSYYLILFLGITYWPVACTGMWIAQRVEKWHQTPPYPSS